MLFPCRGCFYATCRSQSECGIGHQQSEIRKFSTIFQDIFSCQHFLLDFFIILSMFNHCCSSRPPKVLLCVVECPVAALMTTVGAVTASYSWKNQKMRNVPGFSQYLFICGVFKTWMAAFDVVWCVVGGLITPGCVIGAVLRMKMTENVYFDRISALFDKFSAIFSMFKTSWLLWVVFDVLQDQ